MTIPSLVILVGLWGGTLVQAPPVKAPPVKEPVKEPAKPAVPSIEEVIAHALRSHPEILVAEAKLAGARADLELTKLTLSQKIVRAKGLLDAARQSVMLVEKELKDAQANVEGNLGTQKTLNEARGKFFISKIQLLEAEAEWKMYEPPASAKKVDAPSFVDHSGETVIQDSVMRAMRWRYISPPLAAPPVAPTDVDQERYKLLMTPLKLKKAEKLDLIEAVKLLRTQPELKSLTLRVPVDVGMGYVRNPPTIEWGDEELTVVSWLQLFADQFNPQTVANAARLLPENRVGTYMGEYDWYVREYGLIFAKVDNKPIGALTLAEFLKTMRNSPAPMK